MKVVHNISRGAGKKRWTPGAVVYQVNLRSLAAREPRNAAEAAVERAQEESPLAYAARNLARLKRLGFTVVYLLPPYPIGKAGRKGIGSPYSSRDFLAVEEEYGTKGELLEFVRKAHRLGLRVIFDITPNHTARDHVWMAEHPEYYVRAADGSAFFDCDWSDTAKLDYTNPGLRAAMIEVYDHWLTCLGGAEDGGDADGIDGFRLDMAHFINDRGFWDEAMAELKRRHPGREMLFLAECYGFGNNLDLFGRGIAAAYDDDFYKLAQYAYAVDAESGATRVRLSEDAMHNGDWRGVLDAWQDGGIAGAAAKILQQYEDTISIVYVTGGASRLNYLVEYLRELIKIPVEYGSHADWLDDDTEDEFCAPEYSALVGSLLLARKYRKKHQPPVEKKTMGEKITTRLLDLFTDQQ